MTPYLLDSGVLLRYVLPRDPAYVMVRSAITRLRAAGHAPHYSAQTMAEFWSVATRPATARGGFGHTPAQADARARLLERAFTRLPESDAAYETWRRLIVANGVSGVQVHDARLAATMLAGGVSHILTFNPSDFARYARLTAVHPADV